MSPLNDEMEQEFFGEEPAPGGAVWMLSFADLLSVLLTFFVMLYSTTAIQNEKWAVFLDAFKDRFHMAERPANVQAYLPEAQTQPQEAQGSDLDYLRTVMAEKIATYPELRRAQVIRWRNRLLISFPMDAFFKNGAYLPKESRNMLGSLVPLFNLLSNHVDVAAVIPASANSNDAAIWRRSLLQADRIAREAVTYGYHSPINAYTFLSLYQQGRPGNEADVPRIDFIIRDTANP